MCTGSETNGVQFGHLDRDVSFTPQCALFVCACASLPRHVNNVLPVDLSVPRLSPCAATKELETKSIYVWKKFRLSFRQSFELVRQVDEDEEGTESQQSSTHRCPKPTVERDKERQASSGSQRAPDLSMNKLNGSWKLPLQNIYINSWTLSSPQDHSTAAMISAITSSVAGFRVVSTASDFPRVYIFSCGCLNRLRFRWGSVFLRVWTLSGSRTCLWTCRPALQVTLLGVVCVGWTARKKQKKK